MVDVPSCRRVRSLNFARSCYLLPRPIIFQGVICPPGVQQRRDNRGSPWGKRLRHRESDGGSARVRELRPQQRNGAGHKGGGSTRSSKRQRFGAGTKAGDRLAGGPQAAPAYRIRQVRLTKRRAFKVASNHGDNRAMARYGRTSNGSLVARGCNSDHAALCSVIQSVFEFAGTRGSLWRQGNAQVYDAGTRLDTVDECHCEFFRTGTRQVPPGHIGLCKD